MGNRVMVPPWGLEGGGEGAAAKYRILRAGSEPINPAPRFGSKAAGVPLRPEDVVVQMTAGGGGWGDARWRDRSSVERDVRLGYVSRESAARDYGLKE